MQMALGWQGGKSMRVVHCAERLWFHPLTSLFLLTNGTFGICSPRMLNISGISFDLTGKSTESGWRTGSELT